LNLPAQSIEQPGPALSEIIAQLQAQLADKNQRKDQALALAGIKIKVLEEHLRLDRIAR
jgi:hypothetical protein